MYLVNLSTTMKLFDSAMLLCAIVFLTTKNTNNTKFY